MAVDQIALEVGGGGVITTGYCNCTISSKLGEFEFVQLNCHRTRVKGGRVYLGDKKEMLVLSIWVKWTREKLRIKRFVLQKQHE